MTTYKWFAHKHFLPYPYQEEVYFYNEAEAIARGYESMVPYEVTINGDDGQFRFVYSDYLEAESLPAFELKCVDNDMIEIRLDWTPLGSSRSQSLIEAVRAGTARKRFA